MVTKGTMKRLSAARRRLERLEETIKPFRKLTNPQPRRPRSEWVPGELSTAHDTDKGAGRLPRDHPLLLD